MLIYPRGHLISPFRNLKTWGQPSNLPVRGVHWSCISSLSMIKASLKHFSNGQWWSFQWKDRLKYCTKAVRHPDSCFYSVLLVMPFANLAEVCKFLVWRGKTQGLSADYRALHTGESQPNSTATRKINNYYIHILNETSSFCPIFQFQQYCHPGIYLH